MRFRTVFAILPLLGLSAVLAHAQVGTATITGRVTDPTGAAVPAVEVVVTNLETNFRFNAVTNTEGLFRVQSLQPGPYRVAFTAAGFKSVVRDSLDVRSGATLPDRRLPGGGQRLRAD